MKNNMEILGYILGGLLSCLFLFGGVGFLTCGTNSPNDTGNGILLIFMGFVGLTTVATMIFTNILFKRGQKR